MHASSATSSEPVLSAIARFSRWLMISTAMATSFRIKAADAAFSAVKDFYSSSRYAERRFDPDVCDFTFGNPQEFPLPGLVAAIRDRVRDNLGVA